jgi:hypothetical protein
MLLWNEHALKLRALNALSLRESRFIKVGALRETWYLLWAMGDNQLSDSSAADDFPITRIEVTRLDAARTQLLGAVWLFFYDGHTIPTHTLTTSAAQILKDLDDNDSGGFENLIVAYAQPGQEKRIRDLIRRPQNFFKHAKENPKGTQSFVIEQALLTLFFTIEQYWKLTGDRPPELAIYRYWFLLNNPKMLHADANERVKGNPLIAMDIGKEKRQLFEEVLAMLKLSQNLRELG